MRKINFVYLILVLLGLSLFSCAMRYTPVAVAWRNTPPGKGGSNAITPAAFGSDYISGGHLHYTTHDWLAEAALEILYEERSSHEFVKDLFNNVDSLKYWYLVGSEIPDTKYQYKVSLFTDCGVVRNDILGTNHMMHDWNGKELVRHGGLQREIDRLIPYIDNSLNGRDHKAIAYYFGAMVHLISDATYYPHLDNYVSDQGLLNRMHFLTKSVVRTGLDFFSINEARLYFDASDINEPREAVYRAGLDTRWGNSYLMSFTASTYEDGTWLYNHKDEFWPSNTQLVESWTALNRPMFGDVDRYFDTLEHNLNTAIYYSAAAMNYLINTGYKGDGCEGTTGEDGPMSDVGVGIPADIPTETGQKQMTAFFGIAGVMSSLLALGIISMIERLKKGLPAIIPGVGRVPIPA